MNKIPEKGFYKDEANHKYYLDGNQLVGVTTVTGQLEKGGLIYWYLNSAKAEVKELIRSGNKISLSEIDNAFKTGERLNEEAKLRGTTFHKMVEEYIKEDKDEKVNDELDKMFTTFKEFVNGEKIKFLESEKVVYSSKYKFAGTLDFVLKYNDKFYLADLKTSTRIYQTHWIQMSGYKIALDEMDFMTIGKRYEIEGLMVINIDKNGALTVDTCEEFDRYRRAFLGLLAVYRTLKN